VQLTKAMASAWARDHIQVNAVLPGWIDTELTQAARRRSRASTSGWSPALPTAAGAPARTSRGSRSSWRARRPDFITGNGGIPVDGGYSVQG